MRGLIENTKMRLSCLLDNEWYVLIAVSAMVAVFLTIMTGHVCVCE